MARVVRTLRLKPVAAGVDVSPVSSAPRAIRLVFLALAGWLALAAVGPLFGRYVHDLVLVLAGGMCVLRAILRREERLAWGLTEVASLVRSSHERWDGEGYPDRLAGGGIPLGSRILAVADSFDAMTGDRPYSGPRTPGDALRELRDCAGTQFDPVVVEAFCAIWAARSAVEAAGR